MHYAHSFDRENIDEPDKWMVEMVIIASVAVGFFMGTEWELNSLRKKLSKTRRA